MGGNPPERGAEGSIVGGNPDEGVGATVARQDEVPLCGLDYLLDPGLEVDGPVGDGEV
jgi:hypothetical protein